MSLLAIGVGLQPLETKESNAPAHAPPTPSPTTAVTGWVGPLRPATDLSVLPVLAAPSRDPRDASLPYIDIVRATGEELTWQLQLRGAPPDPATLRAEDRILEYGLIVDGNADRAADCEIGISTDAPKAGDYRVWVRNLRTGVKEERVGGPYGFPIEFSHPQEGLRDPEAPDRSSLMTFTFLGHRTAPCGRISEEALFHAWAAVTEPGQVAHWDFAPSAAWLKQY